MMSKNHWIYSFRDELGQLYHQLGELSLIESQQLPGLQKGREDVIAAGVGILWNALVTLDFHEIVVSDGDLLKDLFFCS